MKDFFPEHLRQNCGYALYMAKYGVELQPLLLETALL